MSSAKMAAILSRPQYVNGLSLKHPHLYQNGGHIAHHNFQTIFLNGNTNI